MNIIIRLEEDFPQSRLSNRIILQIEFIEPVERILVRMHIQGIDG